MPEIAEVAQTSEIIKKYFKNKYLTHINFISGRYTNKAPQGFDDFIDVLPLKLCDVQSHGKFMWFSFSPNYYIFNTFGLSGSWSFEITDYCRAEFVFDDESIYYCDKIGYGTFTFALTKAKLNAKLKTLGPDWLKNSEQIVSNNFKNYDIPIVILLQDQKKIGSGLGNKLAPEILYRAKINPKRLGSSLTDNEISRLIRSAIYIVKIAYHDNTSQYMNNLHKQLLQLKRKPYLINVTIPNNPKMIYKVYNKEIDPKGNKVRMSKINGNRITYWVPNIQY
jgi:formamidopyrimidine-DNA glycosylase